MPNSVRNPPFSQILGLCPVVSVSRGPFFFGFLVGSWISLPPGPEPHCLEILVATVDSRNGAMATPIMNKNHFSKNRSLVSGPGGAGLGPTPGDPRDPWDPWDPKDPRDPYFLNRGVVRCF